MLGHDNTGAMVGGAIMMIIGLLICFTVIGIIPGIGLMIMGGRLINQGHT